ncbi:MAG: hypothetical protein RIS88_2526 [Pseudomonadota bacterium]|jgi:Cu/Ag efflux protein CusF
MNTRARLSFLALGMGVFAVALPAVAQGLPTAAPAASTPNPTAADMASGEVRRVDKAVGKLTLRHGEIKSLDMPPMTMVFQVLDATWLDRLKVGDKVRFRADQQGGAYRVIELQLAP